MTDLPTIDIKGKAYVLVSDRVLYFNKEYPEGSITTKLVSDYNDPLVVIKATVRPDMASGRKFTGYSQAKVGDGFINKTSALENAETSAVGRALAMMGIGVIDSIASADELKKTTTQDTNVVAKELATKKNAIAKGLLKNGLTNFDDQIKYINGVLGKETIDSAEEADKVLETL